MNQSEKASSGTKKNKSGSDAIIGVTSEVLFVILPLFVLALVSIHKSASFWDFLCTPEISFAAAILFGQSIVKFVSGISVANARSWERVALLVSGIIVLFLVPTLIILSLLMTSVKPEIWIVWAQIILFILSIATFIIMGGLGSLLLKEHGSKSETS